MNAIAYQTPKDIAKNYAHWLRDNIFTAKRGDFEIISTPFLDPFNDGIEIAIDRTGGETILHDCGRTINNLLDLGVEIDKSERRKQIIQHAIAGCGVKFNEQAGRLEIIINQSNSSQRMHFLTTAIMRLNDLWMTASPRTATDFFEVVKEYFDEHNVLYTANKNAAGQSVEHPIDFIIPLRRGKERLIKLISRPSLQAAKLASFAWMDLDNAGYEAEKYILINDPVDDKPKVNETIFSVLENYSDSVIHWKDAMNDDNFVTMLRSEQ